MTPDNKQLSDNEEDILLPFSVSEKYNVLSRAAALPEVELEMADGDARNSGAIVRVSRMEDADGLLILSSLFHVHCQRLVSFPIEQYLIPQPSIADHVSSTCLPQLAANVDVVLEYREQRGPSSGAGRHLCTLAH